MTWQRGSQRVCELLTAGELEQVVPDQALADRLLQDAQRHLDTAAVATTSGDLSGAYQLAYDAFRKSGAALLAAQGLRATSRGGHIAIQDSITAQFAATVRVFGSFGRIRRARNSFEYPSTDAAGPHARRRARRHPSRHQSPIRRRHDPHQNILTPW